MVGGLRISRIGLFFFLRGIRLLLPSEPVVQQVSRCPLVMLTFSDWGLFARLISEIVNRSSCPFLLLRQGFLSHSGPLPGLDLVFRRADPVLSIRRYDVNRYTCFSSEFLFGPLNVRNFDVLDVANFKEPEFFQKIPKICRNILQKLSR